MRSSYGANLDLENGILQSHWPRWGQRSEIEFGIVPQSLRELHIRFVSDWIHINLAQNLKKTAKQNKRSALSWLDHDEDDWRPGLTAGMRVLTALQVLPSETYHWMWFPYFPPPIILTGYYQPNPYFWFRFLFFYGEIILFQPADWLCGINLTFRCICWQRTEWRYKADEQY